MVGPRTRTWPCALLPIGSPTNNTNASRLVSALAGGQGWLSLQVPSISRAAMPANRMRGHSAHQTGPSPSQTRVGVQSNEWPDCTMTAERNSNMVIRFHCALPGHLNYYRGSGDGLRTLARSPTLLLVIGSKIALEDATARSGPKADRPFLGLGRREAAIQHAFL